MRPYERIACRRFMLHVVNYASYISYLVDWDVNILPDGDFDFLKLLGYLIFSGIYKPSSIFFLKMVFADVFFHRKF